jgi:hypothetical protein
MQAFNLQAGTLIARGSSIFTRHDVTKVTSLANKQLDWTITAEEVTATTTPLHTNTMQAAVWYALHAML